MSLIAAGLLSVPEIRTLLARLLFHPIAKLGFVYRLVAMAKASPSPRRQGALPQTTAWATVVLERDEFTRVYILRWRSSWRIRLL
jgi:hypothetical protein